MKKFTLIIMIIFIAGCAGLDSALSTRGVINSHMSKFDQTKIVTMSPSLTNHGGNYPEFGLYWEEKYGNIARLVVEIDGAVNFDREKDLELIIDGNKFSLRPASKSDFGGVDYDPIMKQNASQKNYIISKEQILKIANGKEGAYRLHLLRYYVDGDINYGYQNFQTYIPKPFREFYKTAWGNN